MGFFKSLQLGKKSVRSLLLNLREVKDRKSQLVWGRATELDGIGYKMKGENEQILVLEMACDSSSTFCWTKSLMSQLWIYS